ncbi:MAG: hypothetical protein PHZ10_06510 [Aliarcobacter cryaerophilus]|nr:hypothetical protein [Aliarcobacter cryaerophilus]
MRRIKQIIVKNGRFFIDYLIFLSFLKKEEIIIKDNKNCSERVCIVVLPWMGTAVSWYAISLALALNKKSKNVFILLDDIPFGDDEFFHKVQSSLILKVLKKINIEYKILSTYKSSQDIDKNLINKLAKLNSLHYTRGETNIEKRTQYEEVISKQLANTYSKQEEFFYEESFNQIILPGGIWGSSGIFSYFAQKNKIQLTTYDCGEGILLLSIFGVSAQLKDIPYSFNKLLESEDEKNFAIKMGKSQLEKRRSGKDMYNHFSHENSLEKIPNEYYLMLLNSVWDSAALGLHTVYENMIDWILDSIKWVIENTDKNIVIRQHPAERVEVINNTDSYERKILDKFGRNERIVFIEAKNDVNTYDLIEKSFCVLGFSSTSIVESVALGKPAIIVSNTYYADFKIVYNANNKEDYYNYLIKASKEELEVSQEMKDRACVCNYITQSCNWYKTEFTPNRNNFLKWSKRSLEELEKDYLPLQAILENNPVSILKHKENYFAH